MSLFSDLANRGDEKETGTLRARRRNRNDPAIARVDLVMRVPYAQGWFPNSRYFWYNARES